MNAEKLKTEIRRLNNTAEPEYQGSLGNVVQKGRYFFASKDGILVGTYKNFEQAMEALRGEEAYENRPIQGPG